MYFSANKKLINVNLCLQNEYLDSGCGREASIIPAWCSLIALPITKKKQKSMLELEHTCCFSGHRTDVTHSYKVYTTCICRTDKAVQ